MTTVQQTQGAVVISSNPEPPSTGRKCCGYATAILSFLTGGGVFILGITTIAYLPAANWARDAATGIWMGAIICFTGMLGVASTWKDQNKVLKGFYIFMGVITPIMCVIAIILFAIATVWYAITLDCNVQGLVNQNGQINLNVDNCDKKNVAIGLHVTMMLFCGFEFIVSIVGACMACACCCASQSHNTVVVAPQPMAMQPQGYQGQPQQGYAQPQQGYQDPNMKV